jgi:hypothetical protein
MTESVLDIGSETSGYSFILSMAVKRWDFDLSMVRKVSALIVNSAGFMILVMLVI